MVTRVVTFMSIGGCRDFFTFWVVGWCCGYHHTTRGVKKIVGGCVGGTLYILLDTTVILPLTSYDRNNSGTSLARRVRDVFASPSGVDCDHRCARLGTSGAGGAGS